MKVSELIALLQTQDPNATIGTSISNVGGWVSELSGKILRAPDGTLALDQTGTTLHEEEQDLRPVG
jgi:hypothetical protein